ncbi:MAG: SIS domain-containing protein, partial [Microgenomates group bacterium]
VASTKAYIAMLLFFVELSLHMSSKADLDRPKYQSLLKQLLSQGIKKQMQAIATRLAKLDHLYVVGRGDLVSIAQEAALKFKEIGYLHAEAIVSGEFKHGPLALISHNTSVLVIKRADDLTIEYTIAEIKARGGKPIVLDIPDLGLYSPLYGATAVHLISFYDSILKGINPDMPRNLAKSVTVK